MRFVTRCLVLTAFTMTGCSGSNTTAPGSSNTTVTQTDLVVGTGATANSGNTVTVNYSGWVYDRSKTDGKGAMFDSANGASFTLGSTSLISGFSQGVIGMQVGGQRRLIIPPSLAYGNSPPAGSIIPANATLVFDITLISVQ